jgi:spore cortex formation protein SpoVR/YcgB (stage V sporulation)
MHSKNDDRTKPVTFEEAIYPYIDSDVYEQETLDYNKKLQELRQKLDKCDRDCLDWLITNRARKLLSMILTVILYVDRQAQPKIMQSGWAETINLNSD